MLGEGDDQIEGTTRTQITQIMQGAFGAGIASGTEATAGATPATVIAAALFDTWRGQIGSGRDALSDVGNILFRSKHGSTLLTQVSSPIVITLARPDLGHQLC